MRTIPDRINLRAFCIEQAVKTFAISVEKGQPKFSVINAAKCFEEYITEGIELPDHAHYPDTFLTVNNNNCPLAFEDEGDEDEGIGFN